MFWLFSPLTVGITDKAISRNTSCTRNHKAIYIYHIKIKYFIEKEYRKYR